MNCKHCGKDIKEEYNFCAECGMPTKNKSNIIYIVGVILVVISCTYFIYNAFFYNKSPVLKDNNQESNQSVEVDDKKETDDIEETLENKTEEVKNDNKEEVKKPSGTVITYNGHRVTIPEGYTYKIVNEMLTITSPDSEWYAAFAIRSAKYSQLKQKKDEAKQYFTDSGFSVGNVSVQNRGNREWLFLELSNNMGSCLAAYTPLTSFETVAVVAEHSNGGFNYEVFDDISNLVKNIR